MNTLDVTITLFTGLTFGFAIAASMLLTDGQQRWGHRLTHCAAVCCGAATVLTVVGWFR